MITAEVSDEEQWSIEEATKKFQPQEGKDYWKIAFKEGVNVDQQVLEKNFGQKYRREYHARYDLTFVVSSGHELRGKVRRRMAGRKIQPAQNLILYPNS